MNTSYECFLDENRNINYKKSGNMYPDNYPQYYTKIINVNNSIPKILHKPIIFWNMIPSFNFSLYTQDPWPLRFTTKNTKPSPHKSGSYLFQTYVKQHMGKSQIYITNITENRYINKSYARIFRSPFNSNLAFTKGLAYFKCFPKFKFYPKDCIS